MRHATLPPQAASGFPSGGEMLPLGMLMIAGFLQHTVVVFFLLNGVPYTSEPHMHLNAVLTPAVFLVALVWSALRLLRLVTPETATGFSLAAFGLAARALAELADWVGPPPGRAVWTGGVSPTLIALVRYSGAIAYVAGLAFVVAMSAQAVGRRAGGRLRVERRRAAWLAALACLAAVLLLVWHWTPAVIRLRAR